MDKRRCIGLIGGLGPGAAVHYYKKLAEAHAKQNLTLDLVMVHAETSRVFEYAGADDREGLARYLSSFIVRFRSAGAELAQTGEGSEAQYRGLTDLALNFCKRDSLDAILLAGTDLSLIFNEANIRFPYIDCAALHIEAILQKVLHQESLRRT